MWFLCGVFTVALLLIGAKAHRKGIAFREQEICFSVQDSFCETDMQLELTTMVPADIYYTEDGSLPSRESIRYEGPIALEAEEEEKAVPIRAIAYYADGSESEVCTRTYFLGKQVEERFTTMVVSISCDPDDLYGYENGILVPGKIRDDYMAMVPDADEETAPGNFSLRGIESEREAYVEMWEPDGTQVISQRTGIRVHGGTSRLAEMKSLRLISREEYGKSALEYEFFPDTESGRLSDIYQKLLLRNHGNDHNAAYMRDELAARLAEEAGFSDTQRARAAVVYVNGEYYGFEWLKETYDDVYFYKRYGTQTGEGSWQIVTPHRGNASTDSEETAELRAVQDSNQMYSYQYRDLRDDAVFAELEELLDIENYLQYCAVEIYLSNPDWPNNNCKMYRWYSNAGGYEAGQADGKWRFLLYDMDVGMARSGSSGADNPTLGEVLGSVESHWDRQEYLFQALMQREDMQKRFTEIVEELMEGAFSYENACRVIEELSQEMNAELDVYLWSLTEAGETQETREEQYQEQKKAYQEEIEKIREFFRLRPGTMREELQKLPEYVNMEK